MNNDDEQAPKYKVKSFSVVARISLINHNVLKNYCMGFRSYCEEIAVLEFSMRFGKFTRYARVTELSSMLFHYNICIVTKHGFQSLSSQLKTNTAFTNDSNNC